MTLKEPVLFLHSENMVTLGLTSNILTPHVLHVSYTVGEGGVILDKIYFRDSRAVIPNLFVFAYQINVMH